MLLSGCATVVKGRTQNLTVATDPPAAACELHRKGKLIGAVSPTPGNIQVDKSSADIDLSCTKPNYLKSETKVSSSFQSWTLGNAILGGLVGVVVDAGSGAAHEYQSTLTVKLIPESFASEGERTKFFEALRSDIAANDKLKKKDKEAHLSRIETEKSRTRIAAMNPSHGSETPATPQPFEPANIDHAQPESSSAR